MNLNQSKSTENFLHRSIPQPLPNRFILIIASLLLALGVGYVSWRELQLHATQRLIRDCFEHQDCVDNIEGLEQLVKAKKSLKLLNLKNANLSNAHLEKANLESANLEQVNLSNSHLEKANLKNANLSLTQIVRTHLESAHLENANLSNAHLANAYLINANLEGAYLSRAHLQGAYFNRSHLQGAHFYHADFEQVNFHRANLALTYFYRPNFQGAHFYGANLQEANLIEAQNLTPAQIKSACNWQQAIYKGVWELNNFRWVADEEANQQFIQQLQQDKDSDPQQPVDCSEWM